MIVIVYIYIYIYIYISLSIYIYIYISLSRLLRKLPMDLGLPPHMIKSLLEPKPLKSRFLTCGFRRLAEYGWKPHRVCPAKKAYHRPHFISICMKPEGYGFIEFQISNGQYYFQQRSVNLSTCIYTYICLSLSIYIYLFIHLSLSLSLSIYIYIYIYRIQAGPLRDLEAMEKRRPGALRAGAQEKMINTSV